MSKLGQVMRKGSRPTWFWLLREHKVSAVDAVPYRVLERDAALSIGDSGGKMLIEEEQPIPADAAASCRAWTALKPIYPT